ncbi:hypothetical protein PVAG01_02575 [Phlyctema vagabunda]|uniref:Proteophosphoglycan 5 n=1 Tax=Phlyctema vagabunda TaxID=108571 RepID=A0ABR4PR82_9HELO
MSNVTVPPKRHRATRTAAIQPTLPSSEHTSNHSNMPAYAQNNQAEGIQPSTPPRTPRNNQFQTSQSALPQSAAGSGTKQRTRNKNRPKNVMTSPAVNGNARNLPHVAGAQSAGIPISAKTMATPSTTAYAGPTFHASPAPSALPIPSFYSKSVPDSPGFKGLKTLRENSPGGVTSPPMSNAAKAENPVDREESPLDLFFKADREEKARARSASSNLTSVVASGPFPPPAASPNGVQTPSFASQNVARNRNSTSGVFAMELDGPGSPGTPYGPAFSTPYSERIKAARSTTTPSRPRTNSHLQQSTDRSEALKAYLFGGPPQSAVSPPDAGHPSPLSAPLPFSTGPQRSQFSNNSPTYDAKAPSNNQRAAGRASGLRQEVTPSSTPTRTPDRNVNYSTSPTPSRGTGHRNGAQSNNYMANKSHTNSPTPNSPFGTPSLDRSADIQGMEDSLRKILKLDSTSNVASSSVANMPSAAASVPNYVGGRAPPMNGMHNGVMGS